MDPNSGGKPGPSAPGTGTWAGGADGGIGRPSGAVGVVVDVGVGDEVGPNSCVGTCRSRLSICVGAAVGVGVSATIATVRAMEANRTSTRPTGRAWAASPDTRSTQAAVASANKRWREQG